MLSGHRQRKLEKFIILFFFTVLDEFEEKGQKDPYYQPCDQADPEDESFFGFDWIRNDTDSTDHDSRADLGIGFLIKRCFGLMTLDKPECFLIENKIKFAIK